MLLDCFYTKENAGINDTNAGTNKGEEIFANWRKTVC
jgi:hypothetical protein